MKPDSRAPAKTPNYFCTWSTQNYLYGCGLDALDNAELEGASGAMHARESMTEAMKTRPPFMLFPAWKGNTNIMEKLPKVLSKGI